KWVAGVKRQAAKDAEESSARTSVTPRTWRGPDAPSILSSLTRRHPRSDHRHEAPRRDRSAVFVYVLRIDAETDPWLACEVSRVLTVALGVLHGVGECLLALVDERGMTTDRDVMQVVTFVMDDQSDPRITADVGHPAAIPMSVELDVVLAKH